jgi:hypothetical protein
MEKYGKSADLRAVQDRMTELERQFNLLKVMLKKEILDV